LTTDTSTLEQARAHARAQAGTTAATGPTVPTPEGLLWQETLGTGGYAARLLPRDAVLRLTDTDGDACVQLLAFVAARPAERLNVADTVKVQWQAYLAPGALLLSDMGRALLTIVEDTSARHDCLCGGGNRRASDARWGDGSVWGGSPNPRDLLALAAAKHGLGRGDLPPWINLFKAVRVDDAGALTLDGEPEPGTHVELRAELDVLVLLANTPHPLDDRADHTATTVRVEARMADRPDDDPLRTATPERERAFQNTDEVLR
jgi:urea carboxylase-associated protein 2